MSKRPIFSLAPCVALCVVGVAAMLCLVRDPARAQSSTRYVAPTGTDSGDCTNPSTPCRTVQYAVDTADHQDLIKVATGVYTDVQGLPVPPWYDDPPASGIITQVVYISKTVIVRGGYAASDFAEPPDPKGNPTTLDAQGQGRVLVIAGNISTTLEGLLILGGNSDGLGGKPADPYQHEAGSGGFVMSATVTIIGAEVRENDGWGHGGGLYLYQSDATLISNTISHNVAFAVDGGGKGGGLYLDKSDVTLISNTISDNGAFAAMSVGKGGGLYLDNSSATLVNNTISGNKADGFGDGGGGLYLDASSATLIRNTVSGNRTGSYSGSGGGLYLGTSSVTLISNTISGNSADGSRYSSGSGGGLLVVRGDAVLIGNTISHNGSAGRHYGRGGGVSLSGVDATLISNTIRGNGASGLLGGSGCGVYVQGGSLELIGNTIRENNCSVRDLSLAGGLLLADCDRATLINNVIAGNRAKVGSELYLENCPSRLLHTTLVGSGGNDSGVHVDRATTVALTNTILAGHTVAITVAAGSSARLEATLWGASPWANETDWAGEGDIFTGTVNLWGNPAFVDHDTGNYHIAGNSAAKDAGVNAGVTTDIDGQSRPRGSGYDIGADEYWATSFYYLPLVLRKGR